MANFSRFIAIIYFKIGYFNLFLHLFIVEFYDFAVYHKQVLTGHEGAVHGLAMSPIEPLLASCSADKTLRIWTLYESKFPRDPIQLTAEGYFSNEQSLTYFF